MLFSHRTPSSAREQLLENPPYLAPEVLQKLLTDAYCPVPTAAGGGGGNSRLSTLREEDENEEERKYYWLSTVIRQITVR